MQVRIHHIVSGIDISADAVEDAIRLSEEKYCSVGAMVKLSADLHTTFKIVPATVAGIGRGVGMESALNITALKAVSA